MNPFQHIARIISDHGLKSICVAALTLLAIPPAYSASFRVSPTRFEFSLNNRFTNFFTVTNTSGDGLRVRVYAGFIETTDDHQIVEKTGHPYDLSPWIVFSPRTLSIRPGQKRTVRFSVRAPKSLQDGEYRGVIFFEELPAPEISIPVDKTAQDLQLSLQFNTRIGATIYGMVGERKINVEFRHEMVTHQAENISIVNSIENTGNAHITLEISAKLKSESGDQIAIPDNAVVIQPGNRERWIVNADQSSAGKYTLFVVGRYKNQEVLNVEVPIDTSAPQ